MYGIIQEIKSDATARYIEIRGYMKTKQDLIWGISLIVIGIDTLVLTGSKIIGLTLPDVVARIIGIIDLIALPFFAYTTVKKAKKKTNNYVKV